MNNFITCPICKNMSGGNCRELPTNGRDANYFECDVCGKFALSGSVFAGPLDPEKAELTGIQRATLSHLIRQHADDQSTPQITTDWLNRVLRDPQLPSPSAQATNIIRYIGDHVLQSGTKIDELPPKIVAIIGSATWEFSSDLVQQLKKSGLVSASLVNELGRTAFLDVGLTLDGWKEYEKEKHGQTSGNYGFIAMKFGDDSLDKFVDEVIKPTLLDKLGYHVVNMLDVAQAGVIDNIMRAQIRDAAFVLVDLTHDNSGAYWEAGYAEGLGKPVIYICEKKKFDEAKTHFDTNHCTTVLWDNDNHDNFCQELVATLRRSLNLFPTTSS